MAKFDHFNLISPIYDWVFKRRNNHKLSELLGLTPHHILLDIGGGTGRVASHFVATSDHTFVADAAVKMLREAQKKGISTINVHSERLPFCNYAFDRIIMVDAFHHVIDQQATLDEIWRTLTPGGRLVIEEPDINNFFVKLIALGEKLLLMRSKFIKPQDILAMVSYNDVKNIQLCSEKGIAWAIIDKDNYTQNQGEIDG